MIRRLKKYIVLGLFLSVLTTFIMPSKKVEAQVLELQTIQEVSASTGVLAPLVFAGGIMIYEGYQVYEALKENNFGIIKVAKVPWLPEEGTPNSVIEKINPNTNEIMQRRYYDEEGKAFIDIDYGDHGYPESHPWTIQDRVIHKHTWDWSKEGKKKRSSGKEITLYEYIKYVQLPEAFPERSDLK